MANDPRTEIVRGSFDWAKGQPYQNVIATVLVVAFIAGLPWAVREVKDLYAKQEASHREERAERDKGFIGAIERLGGVIEKSDEKHGHWFQGKAKGEPVGEGVEADSGRAGVAASTPQPNEGT